MIKKYHFTISNLFLITACIYLCVNGFYKIVTATLEDVHIPKEVPYRETAPDAEVNRPLSYYSIITERNLFDTKGKPVSPVGKEEIPKDLQETELDLTLWGTVSGGDNKGYAVIEDRKDRKQNLYRVGDSIQDAALKMILREKVILTRNGKDEELKMEDPNAIKKGKGSGFAGAAERGAGEREEGGGRTVNLKRAQIDESLNNINELMKQVQIKPHFEDGKPNGLMLSNIKSKSIFRQMGLRNGDVVIGIDGQNIESVDDALKFYESLKSTETVSLQIKRRGQSKTIDYKIQ